MKITPELLDKLAQLVRLHIPDEDRTAYLEDLDRMLSFVEQLSAANTDGVLPLVHPVEGPGTLAADIPASITDPQGVLAQAPARTGDFFETPKIVHK